MAQATLGDALEYAEFGGATVWETGRRREGRS
jgi:hypothetical protein